MRVVAVYPPWGCVVGRRWVARQGLCPGMWQGVWGRVAVGFGCVLGGRSGAGLASAQPQGAGEEQSRAVLATSSSSGAPGLRVAVSWQGAACCGVSTPGTHWSPCSLGSWVMVLSGLRLLSKWGFWCLLQQSWCSCPFEEPAGCASYLLPLCLL